MDHFTCALLGLIHFPPKTSHLGDPMHIFTFLCIRDDQFKKNLNFTTEGALKSKKLRKETMLEIEKYIKKHVGRKVLLTLTFSPSPTIDRLFNLPLGSRLSFCLFVQSSPREKRGESYPREFTRLSQLNPNQLWRELERMSKDI